MSLTNKPVKLGVIMDPIQNIRVKEDATRAMLLAAQARNWEIYYMEQSDLFIQDVVPKAQAKKLKLYEDHNHWFDFTDNTTIPLADLDVILMRKDPPFDMEYIYTTYLLELAEAQGTLIVNKPQSLRDANEKLFTSWFPQCCPPHLVTRNAAQLKEFINFHTDAILKPLHGMGGANIFRLRAADPNINVVIENLTENGTKFIMAQRYIPEITNGDKRILMINGEPIPHALARFAAAGETRANILAGGSHKLQPLSERDKWICDQVGPTLRAKGLWFVGIDIIGDYLTEINVTSPGCIREISESGVDVAAKLIDFIATQLTDRLV